MRKTNQKNQGYALYTAIILTGILILVAYITADISIKQLLLSVSGADSHIAFYNADAGLECALYGDLKNANGTQSIFDVGGNLSCNGQTFPITPGGGGPVAPFALIHAGGGSYGPDSSGQTWAADNSYSGGGTFSTASSISGTTDQGLYQTERNGDMTYTITGMTPNSTRTVVLKLAEIYFSNPGERVFNVKINGTTVLSNFDIVVDAGGGFKVDDKTFTTTADGSGTITIQFISVVNNAKISAIQISGVSSGGGSNTFQLDFTQGCAVVTVTKSGGTLIESHGYNSCTGSKRLERGIKIQY